MSTINLAAPHSGAAALYWAPIWPMFEYQGRRRHVWVQYVVSSGLAPMRGVSLGTPVFSSPQELTLQKF